MGSPPTGDCDHVPSSHTPPMSATSSSDATVAVHDHDRTWLVVLGGGVAVWLLASFITWLTRDNILVPTVILVGSFLVPVTVMVWAMSLRRADRLTPRVIFLGFLAGGTLGVLASALVETYVLPRQNGTYLAVGLIEEGAKALVLLAVAHQVRARGPRDGMVLGAIVGAGFAAFESSGYAFSTIIEHIDDRPVYNILQTEFSRAILAPFGHILWTSLVGGALFAGVSATGRFRLTSQLVWTYLGVVALHGLWDASTGYAIVITRGLVGEGWSYSWPNVANWIGQPTRGDVVLYNVIYDVLLGLNAVVGTCWVVRRYRRYTRGLERGDLHVVELV